MGGVAYPPTHSQPTSTRAHITHTDGFPGSCSSSSSAVPASLIPELADLDNWQPAFGELEFAAPHFPVFENAVVRSIASRVRAGCSNCARHEGSSVSSRGFGRCPAALSPLLLAWRRD